MILSSGYMLVKFLAFVHLNFLKVLLHMKFYWLFCACLLSGCGARKRLVNHDVQERVHLSKKKRYEMTISGIECRQCVLTVLHRLRTLNNISNMQCICPLKNFECSSFEFFISSKKEGLPINEIVDILRSENFELSTLQGAFLGRVLNRQGAIYFKCSGLEQECVVVGKERVLQRLMKYAEADDEREIVLRGLLNFDVSTLCVDSIGY
jgi:hypothetical protein